MKRLARDGNDHLIAAGPASQIAQDPVGAFRMLDGLGVERFTCVFPIEKKQASNVAHG
ncbi:hypothetical protein [Caballeronia sp. dw_19]|uniref:hypothetical protein n=1 Tax=Caballeronia sp. dw_19 TaxID=2719791 RepID=UPI001BD5923E|nr:hypothetical protein [Caballeronia sp. dw_19]